MGHRIKISEPMVRTIVGGTVNTPQGVAVRGTAAVGTRLALRDRGLTRMAMIRNGDLADYTGDYPEVQNRYEILTDRGRYLRRYLSTWTTGRSWDLETLDSRVAAWISAQAPVCGDVNPSNDRITCQRPQGHPGDHRPTTGYIGSSAEWQSEPTVVLAQPEPVFTVKLYYATGAFEAPTGAESLCRTVFEEALSNERVIAAELCGPDKRVLEAFGRSETKCVDCGFSKMDCECP